jgi:Ca2+-binding EF-hand superfamily protein
MISQGLVADIVQSSDANADGKISYEEFAPWSPILYYVLYDIV